MNVSERPRPANVLGPKHWKLVELNPSTLQVVPSGFMAVAVFAAVVFAVLLAGLWWIPTVPVDVKVAMTAVGLMAGAVIVAFFLWLDHYERRQGPYLVITEHQLRLRSGREVRLQEFASFEIRRKWESLADVVNVSRLILKCTNGNEFEIVATTIHREAVKLQRSLDQRVRAVLAARYSGGVS